MTTTTPLPEVPEVDDVEMAFSTTKHLPPWSVLTEQERRGDGPYCDCVQHLFFMGGKITDHLTPKPGADVAKITRLFRALAGSFEPKHEHKIGGIAHLLAQWFDPKGKSDA